MPPDIWISNAYGSSFPDQIGSQVWALSCCSFFALRVKVLLLTYSSAPPRACNHAVLRALASRTTASPHLRTSVLQFVYTFAPTHLRAFAL